MIGWTSGRFWNHTVKAQRPEIQLIDKHVDHPHRVVLSNVVIQILGKQNALYTVFTLDEARHLTPRRESSRIITQQSFSHSLHPLRMFGSELTGSGPCHVKAASLRASNAMAMSEAPPNTMSIPTSRPSAQTSVPGKPEMMIPARIKSMTPFTRIHSHLPASSRRWAMARMIIKIPSTMK